MWRPAPERAIAAVNWAEVFLPTVAPLELVVRGSAIYLGLFVVFRVILKRDVGAVGVSDLLLVVLIADAAQNAMAGDYKSIGDGVVLLATLVSWNYLIDWLAFRVPALEKLTRPGPLVLVRDGRKLRRNMRRELISDNELDALLREQGIAHLDEVRMAMMEGDGELSVIRAEQQQGNDDGASGSPTRRRAQLA